MLFAGHAFKYVQMSNSPRQAVVGDVLVALEVPKGQLRARNELTDRWRTDLACCSNYAIIAHAQSPCSFRP